MSSICGFYDLENEIYLEEWRRSLGVEKFES